MNEPWAESRDGGEVMFLDWLRRGAGLLVSQTRRRIADAIAATVTSEGGFQGRAGTVSDPYYAPFAVASWKALGVCAELPAGLPGYLRRLEQTGRLDDLHRRSVAMAWVLAGQPEAARQALRSVPFLAKDGRQAGTSRNAAYTRFLDALLARAGVLEQAVGGSDTMELSRSCGSCGTTVPEWAAYLIGEHWRGAVPDRRALAAVEACVQPGGGLGASPQAERADLLSTATGLLALRLGGRMQVPGETRRQVSFVTDCWRDTGLFAASPDDPDPAGDTEYTFYALLALGALV